MNAKTKQSPAMPTKNLDIKMISTDWAGISNVSEFLENTFYVLSLDHKIHVDLAIKQPSDLLFSVNGTLLNNIESYHRRIISHFLQKQFVFVIT
jgi:hypothetical protein